MMRKEYKVVSGSIEEVEGAVNGLLMRQALDDEEEWALEGHTVSPTGDMTQVLTRWSEWVEVDDA